MGHTLVLLRHGQSIWNQENLFTGWYDSDLSERGCKEAEDAGELMKESGIRPDIVHTSLLVRAVRTANIALDEMAMLWLPVHRTWRLNERHYGALQGQNKKQAAEEFGSLAVKRWRRSYDVRPPPVGRESEHHPINDPRYRDLYPALLPAAECLADVLERMLPWWVDEAAPELRAGRTLLVAAHGNSLRALVKHLEDMSAEDVVELNIPTGVPLVYDLDDDLRPRSSGYLDPEAAEARAREVASQAEVQPEDPDSTAVTADEAEKP
jgi:2,3-bisphosphoglycerate-dependent phosphoglycerate mutase